MAIEDDAGRASEEILRIPAGVMNLLRQSYSTREKVLDWLLAGAVAAVALYAAWPMLKRRRLDQTDMVPNQDVKGALGAAGSVDTVYKQTYTYNLPPGRRIAHRVGPSPYSAPRPPIIGPISAGVSLGEPDNRLGAYWPPHEPPVDEAGLDPGDGSTLHKFRTH